MATVTKFANANTVITTGFTNPTNAYADDGSYATAIPAKNSSVTTDYGFPAFTTSDIPAGSTINSVTAEIQFKVSATNAIITVGLQLDNSGLLGTESTNTAEPAADTLLTKQETSGITLANLQSANQVQARVRAGNGSSSNAVTVSVDYVTLTVDYTIPPPVTKTITGKAAIQKTTTRTITGKANITNSPPTVALNSPADAATGIVGLPTLNFTGTDIQGDTIEYQTQVFEKDLNLSFRFEDGSGASIANNALINTLGAGAVRLGTWNGTLGSQWGTGKIGGGAVFNGTDNYVTVAGLYEQPLDQSGAVPFSVAFWFKTTAGGANVYTMAGKCKFTAPYTGYQIGLNVNTGLLADAGKVGAVLVDNSTVVMRRSSNATYNDGNWHYLVFTYDGSKTRAGMRLFVDDAEVTYTDQDSTSFPGTLNNTAVFEIGARDGSNQNFPGEIDEFTYWTKELDTQDMTDLWNSSSGRVIKSLDKISTADSGFTAGHPFASGTPIDFIVQTGDELYALTDYWWRVRGKDPSGSNTYGAYSTVRSFTTDSGSTITPQTITGVARITASTTKTETGKAAIQKTTIQTIDGKSRIQKVVTQTIQGLARITASTLRTIQGLAQIRATTTRAESGVARIQKAVIQTIQGLSRITAATTRTIQGVAKITATTLRTIQGVAQIRATTTRTETGVARIQKSVTQIETGVARIQKVIAATIQGLSRITATTARTIQGVAKITATTLRTISGVSRIRNITLRTISGISRIQKAVAQTIIGVAKITAITTRTIQGVARISILTTRTIQGLARITASTIRNITGTAAIRNVTLRTIQGVSRIQKAVSQTISGLSRITATTTRNMTGVARVDAGATSQTITGVSRIENTTTRTETGKARIEQSTEQTIDGVARIQKSVIVRTVHSTLLNPRTMADDATIGVLAWLNVDNAKESDNVYSTTTAFSGETETRAAHYLKATNFGFNIPAGATIQGIKAEVERKKNTTSVVQDYSVKIVKANGSFGSENKAASGIPLWSSSDTYREYGGENDLWSESWTPADINDEDFGFGFSVTVMSDDNTVFASVDHMRITVYYYVDSIFGVARIEKAVSQVITGVADILNTTLKTIAGKARIQKSTTALIAGLSRITANTLRTIQGVSKITATTLRTITGKTRIQKIVQAMISGISRIQKTTSQVITGKARIRISVIQTETGVARIRRTSTQTESGVAKIQKLLTAIITGKSRIQISVDRTILGKARILYTTTKTITGKSALLKIATKNIQGKARLSILTQRNITGVAKIKLPRVFPYKVKVGPYSQKDGPYSNKTAPYSSKVGPYSSMDGPYGDFPPAS